MPDYIEPTQSDFDTAEAVISDVIKENCPTLIQKIGSVVHELIIRPFSYLLAWCKRNTDYYRTQSSVAYLKTSTATINPIADAVASNYFIQRRPGTVSKGVITLTVSQPSCRIPIGSRFIVGGIPTRTNSQIVLTTVPISAPAPDTLYIQLFREGQYYIANIPVETESVGAIEIPIGADISVEFGNSFIITTELTAPITGGSGAETDAELMARCEYSTAASGIGTYYGLRKKLDMAPITVLSMAVVAGEDVPLFRARNNTVGLNPGGYVDCYVKTLTQAYTEYVTVPVESKVQDSGLYDNTIKLGSDVCAGFFAIRKIQTNDSTNVLKSDITVEYGSSDIYNTADGARLSSDQTAYIHFISQLPITEALIHLAYMPGIDILQQYMDSDDNKYIGQDVCIKAAVPVDLGVACAVSCSRTLDTGELNILKSTITRYINNLPVGTAELNFSDLRKICAEALPEAELRVPCTFTASCYMRDGTRDTWYSSTGVLNISNPANIAYWNYKLCFFSITESAISINQL